eukprot:CAMPEP_0206533788 /NCGR_PEP_ID=MMETSP0325_2-20121206/5166_1 /ASSEMBLY_ACC=CAM_ASM_000347 /TAXON_ID=2866 /ORGANISM="Crypthecodinium cohnii, Strain Seligo" /LENGTH=1203 /DNA_ID=CAMNT_0054030483 /DNA_START=114 /DNA_END=3726 /DNA_ORIENTATION=-
MTLASKLEDKQQSKTDARVQKVTEIISAVQVIKCYAWEEPSLQKVEAARAAELRAMWVLYCVYTVFEGLWSSVIPVTTAVMFASYSIMNPSTPLDPATAFTAVSLLGMVQGPLFAIPWVVTLVIESRVAAARLERLFFKQETDLPAISCIGTFSPEDTSAGAAAEAAAAATREAVEGMDSLGSRLMVDFQGESFQWPKMRRRASAEGEEGEGSDDDNDDDDDDGDDTGSISDATSTTAASTNGVSVAVEPSGSGAAAADLESGGGDSSTTSKSVAHFKLSNLHLQVPKGSLVAIVGATASGKTSLLHAVLGEMPLAAGSDPALARRQAVKREKPIAFAPQQPWIFNASIRQNILFGQRYDEKAYREVLKCCDLEKDFELLKAGDMTKVGEKGIALSGGQKARVCLARATYRKTTCDIFLLDDPYSALDAHVARKVHVETVHGALRRKTRFVTTNRLEFAEDCDWVVVLKDGNIDAFGTWPDVRKSSATLQALLEAHGDRQQDDEDAAENSDGRMGGGNPLAIVDLTRATSANSTGHGEEVQLPPPQPHLVRQLSREGSEPDGQEDEEETRASGQVRKEVFFYYLRMMGRPISVMLLAGLYLVSELIQISLPVWLAHWTASSPTEDELPGFLRVYVALSAFSVIFMTVRDIVGNVYGFRAARRMHFAMLSSVLRAPLSFFQDTPHGRIINRFSKDTSEIDKDLIWQMLNTFVPILSCISNLALVSSTAYFALFAFLPVFWMYYKCWCYYNPVVLDIKRITKVSSSPVYDHFNNLCRENAVSTVRAHHQVERECRRNSKLVGEQQRPQYCQMYVENWYFLCVGCMGAFLVFAVGVVVVLTKGKLIVAATAALALTFATQFEEDVRNLIGQVAEFSMAFNCVERVMEYSTTLASEAALTTSNTPPPDWPQAGVLEVKHLEVRYRPGLPLVLKGLTFTTEAGERVGVVGRTGAGKSSLLITLLRIVEPEEGSVLRLDGVDLLTLGLRDLRSKIAMIPQEPILFQESFRYNCDPFGRHSTQEVWHALCEAQLAPWVMSQANGASASAAGATSTSSSVVYGGDEGSLVEPAQEPGSTTELQAGYAPSEAPANAEELLKIEVKEGGQNLSAGQRQMVAIARAVLRRSKFVLLDEATAALDSATDAAIQQAVRRCFAGASTLTIAHRLQTIMDSDRILVLESGSVKELGPPAELRQKEGGVFRAMVEEARL